MESADIGPDGYYCRKCMNQATTRALVEQQGDLASIERSLQVSHARRHIVAGAVATTVSVAILALFLAIGVMPWQVLVAIAVLAVIGVGDLAYGLRARARIPPAGS